MNITDIKDYVSVKEAQDICGCGDLTIKNAINDGKIVAYKDGNKWTIEKKSLIKWNTFRTREKRKVRSKVCKICGKRFKTFDADERFCSADCEDMFIAINSADKKDIAYTSYLTKGLTMAQQCRIIQDLFKPYDEETTNKAVSEWMRDAQHLYMKWLENHSIGEIQGNARVVCKY